jgi:hypothetical protein
LEQNSADKYEEEMASSYTEISKQSEMKFGLFDKNGWKKVYKQGEIEILNYNFGFVMNTPILKTQDYFYSGQVNIQGQKHGYGQLIETSGRKFLGAWFKDDFTCWGRFIDQEGNLSEGNY